MKKSNKALAMMIAGSMVVTSLTACSSKKKEEKNNNASPTETAQADTTNTQTSSSSDTPLVIASGPMNEKFSPIFSEIVPDTNLVGLTQVSLLGTDRQGQIVLKGIEGETRSYNGTDYTYYGIADCDITENSDGSIYYDFKIRDDVKFSDGEPLTIDDVIFSMYAEADPSFDGAATFYSLPIEGMEEYRSGSKLLYSLISSNGKDNKDFTYYSEDVQKKFFETDIKEAGKEFTKSICDYVTNNLAPQVEANEVANAMVMDGVATLNDDGTVTTNTTNTTYTLKDNDVPTYESYFAELEEQYKGDYETLSAEHTCNSTLFSFLDNSYNVAVETGDSAKNISGIQKTGDNTLRVVFTEVNAPAIYQFNLSVMPLHYYGDKAKFDYDNNKFGFDKGDLSSIREKISKPLGAGPYVFEKYENKVAYLTANENYYLGAPKIKNLQLKESTDADMVPGVLQGTIDVCEPNVNKKTLSQIKEENGNGELSGDKLVTSLLDNLGYGYIGMNSELMKVGDDAGSDASKNFRKAIATVVCAYRDVVIDSYYGEAASVINYPISNTSWAAPQKSDSDYEVAFSKDVNGNEIYKDGMTEDEKYAAAKEAALGYFEAAGYTVKDGKITAAPEGGKMECTVLIPADGTGDHPSFGILTAAKEVFDSIGFNFQINDLADGNILWDGLTAGTVEMWCAAWQATPDPDMYQVYHTKGGSSYHYKINQKELDDLVMDGRSSTDQTYRKSVYKEALDYVVDYAVEIPVYQRQNGVVYSAERVNADSWVKDPTPYYNYLSEIQNIEMK